MSNNFKGKKNKAESELELKIQTVKWKFLSYPVNLYKTYWTNAVQDAKASILASIVGAIIGAFIAAIVSLFVVYLQKWQQEEKDIKQSISVEQNKLKYLKFLLDDTYKIVEAYEKNTKFLNNSIGINPFITPQYIYYSPHSLDAIANKINQEEYYLASIHQLENNNVTELLLLCNSLFVVEDKARTYFNGQQPVISAERAKLIGSLESLEREVVNYIATNNTHQLSTREKYVHESLKKLFESTKYRNSYRGLINERLYHTYDIFLNPLLIILKPCEDLASPRKLLYQCYDALGDYNTYLVNIDNLGYNMNKNNSEISSIATKLKVFSKPLDEYVDKLSKK